MSRPPAKPPAERCDELLQSLIDGVPDQLAVLDGAGRIMGVNAAWRSSSAGWLASPEIGVGESYPERCRAMSGEIGAVASSAAALVETLVAGEEPVDSVLEYECKDPSGELWFELRVARLLGPGPPRILVTHRDITRRREAILRSEAANRALLDAIPDLLFRLDRGGTYLAYKPSEDFPTAMAPHEFLGRNLADTLPPEVAEKAMAAIDRTLDTGRIQFLDYQLELEEKVRDYEARFVQSGKNEVLAIIRDITSRKAAESKLRFQAEFEKMAARVSQRFTSLTPEEFKNAIGESLEEAVRFAEVERAWVAFLTLEGDKVQEVHRWKKEGVPAPPAVEPILDAFLGLEELWLLGGEVLAIPQVEDPPPGAGGLPSGLQAAGVRSFLGLPLVSGGAVFGVMGMETVSRETEWTEEHKILIKVFSQVFARAHERRRTAEALQRSEEQLRHSQKMEAVGRLAGGVAHDFNNLLTAISGYTALLLNGLPPGDPLRKDAKEIQRAVERAAALTGRLLAFGRKQVLQPQVFTLNRVIEDMGRMLRLMTGDEIELVVTLDSELAPIQADPGQLEQVITNLVVNARDAMPRGGRLTLETANLELARSVDRDGMVLEPGHYVTLRVSDSGVGMSEETRSRVFEPFFTTKADGTGLGLSTVYGIVKQSGGEIWVESGEDGGSSFTVYFPRSEKVPDPGNSPAQRQVRGGTETVLLVEDQHVVRHLLRRLLQDAGYRVLDAGTGIEAMVLAREHSEPVSVLVTDVVMPGMSGPELAAQLRRVNPEVKTLFLSGYTREAIIDPGALGEGSGFLQKPFSPEVLVQKVREVLEGK